MIVKRIKMLCAENGTTIAAIERYLGFGNGAISKWDNSMPHDNKIESISHYFEQKFNCSVSLEYLKGETDVVYPPPSEDEQLLEKLKSNLAAFTGGAPEGLGKNELNILKLAQQVLEDIDTE